jgi:transcriptional regulator with XRE-family HTH domain
MEYAAKFTAFREARKLSQNGLAALAGCHRNTVVNVERGRAVKFATIAGLMEKMGYSKQSGETRKLALLWFQATTGIGVRLDETGIIDLSRKRSPAVLRAELAARLKRMDQADIEIVHFAVANREIMNALKAIRCLVEGASASP